MLPLALLAADKVWTEEFKEMESRRNELLKSGQIDEALKLFDEMADLEERNGEIDEASKVRRDKISLLHNAQLDSLLIAEAPIQMAWMEQHDKMAYYYRIWRLMVPISKWGSSISRLIMMRLLRLIFIASLC